MRTRLYLVRHGESEDNAASLFGGRRDAALSARGQREADAVARRLAADTVDAVLSSRLGRAQKTAEVIAARHGLEVQVTPDWEEADFGAWEGCTYAQVESAYPEAIRAWTGSPLTVSPTGGESFESVHRRVRAALRALLAEYRGKSVLLVSHGGPIRAALVEVMNAPLEVAIHLTIDSGGLTIVDDFDGHGVVVSLNERVHLRKVTSS